MTATAQHCFVSTRGVPGILTGAPYRRRNDNRSVVAAVGVRTETVDEYTRIECHALAKSATLLRAVTAGLLIGADFDIDAQADLRMAVDEAVSVITGSALDGAPLIAEFHLDDTCLRARLQIASTQAHPPDQRTFAWRVLSALTDSLHAGMIRARDNRSAAEVFIEFTKERRASPPDTDVRSTL